MIIHESRNRRDTHLDGWTSASRHTIQQTTLQQNQTRSENIALTLTLTDAPSQRFTLTLYPGRTSTKCDGSLTCVHEVHIIRNEFRISEIHLLYNSNCAAHGLDLALFPIVNLMCKWFLSYTWKQSGNDLHIIYIYNICNQEKLKYKLSMKFDSRTQTQTPKLFGFQFGCGACLTPRLLHEEERILYSTYCRGYWGRLRIIDKLPTREESHIDESTCICEQQSKCWFLFIQSWSLKHRKNEIVYLPSIQYLKIRLKITVATGHFPTLHHLPPLITTCVLWGRTQNTPNRPSTFDF